MLKIVLLSAYILLNAIAANSIPPKVYLLFGPTRSGKSTFINKIYGDVVTPAGSFTSDQSTTSLCREILVQRDDLLDGHAIMFIDVMGMYDTHLTSNEENMESIRRFLSSLFLQMGVAHIDGILVFQSLQTTTVSVGHARMLLQTLFAGSIDESTVVLVTKEDVLKMIPSLASKIEPRVNLIMDFCAPKSISVMKWSNYNGIAISGPDRFGIELSQEDMAAQVVQLDAVLRGLRPIMAQSIQDSLDELRRRAEEIYEGQEFSTATREIEVEQQALQEYLESVQRTQYVPVSGSSRSAADLEARALEIQRVIGQVESSEMVTIQVPKTVHYYELVETVVRTPYKKQARGIAGAWKKVTRYHEHVDRQVVERTRVELEERQQMNPVMKLMELDQCRAIACQETSYVPQTVSQNETRVRVKSELRRVQVEIPVPALSPEACLEIAKQERLEALRQENALINILQH